MRQIFYESLQTKSFSQPKFSSYNEYFYKVFFCFECSRLLCLKNSAFYKWLEYLSNFNLLFTIKYSNQLKYDARDVQVCNILKNLLNIYRKIIFSIKLTVFNYWRISKHLVWRPSRRSQKMCRILPKKIFFIKYSFKSTSSKSIRIEITAFKIVSKDFDHYQMNRRTKILLN